MRPVDVFLRSVREAFAPSETGPSAAWIGAVLAVIVVGLVAWNLFGRYRIRQAAELAYRRFLTTNRIPAGDAHLIESLARSADTSPMLVATHVDVFEQATSRELGARPTSWQAGTHGIFAQILALRQRLKFDALPEHFPLLTTRELVLRMHIDVSGMAGRIVDVNEACFVAEIPAPLRIGVGPEGSRLVVTLIRGHDARYTANCALLGRESTGDLERLILGHDERPVRIQLRAAVRVSAQGTVHLRPRDNVTGDDSSDTDIGIGSLLDLSLGGIALETRSKIAVGSALRTSFELDGRSFQDLAAWVLDCEPRRRGFYRMRLKFRDLPQAEETALAAVVAKRSAKVV